MRDVSTAIDRYCVGPTTELAQKSSESWLVVLFFAAVARVDMSPDEKIFPLENSTRTSNTVQQSLIKHGAR